MEGAVFEPSVLGTAKLPFQVTASEFVGYRRSIAAES